MKDQAHHSHDVASRAQVALRRDSQQAVQMIDARSAVAKNLISILLAARRTVSRQLHAME